jgi:uncharacterized membrane protein YhaH (DUF805 family)
VATDVPLDQPLYGASFAEAVRRFWLKYAVFSGRAGRAEYWWWALAATVVALVLEVVRFVLLGASLQTYLASPLYSLRWTSVPSLLWFLVTFVPSQALGVRRLHDGGRTGWWQLLTLVVLAGTVVQTLFVPRTVSLTAPPPVLTGTPLVVSTLANVVTLVVEVVLIVFYTARPVPPAQRFDGSRRI